MAFVCLGGSRNAIQGNFIGTDVTGTTDLGNGAHGVLLLRATDSIVGGTEATSRNVISGNDYSGIQVQDGSANTIQGNLIGTDVTGTADLGNGSYGAYFYDTTNNMVGGTGDGAGNNHFRE